MAAKKERPALPVPLVIVTVLLAAGGAGVWLLQTYGGGPKQAVGLTAEAKAYVRHLQLAGVEMKATESYLGQEVVEITGNITNAGDRPLRQVDLNCVFYDPYGQVILRERVSIVRPSSTRLNPGETRAFRMPFDTVPASWSKAMPQLVIAQIVF